ncbi:hypothetical protein [Streptomyces bohaiensis]|uniref:hypothetical protein n=1 Tax=Streptomyces bohaiensis TaxID=1431344 RepID=UPI003B82A86F
MSDRDGVEFTIGGLESAGRAGYRSAEPAEEAHRRIRRVDPAIGSYGGTESSGFVGRLEGLRAEQQRGLGEASERQDHLGDRAHSGARIGEQTDWTAAQHLGLSGPSSTQRLPHDGPTPDPHIADGFGSN